MLKCIDRNENAAMTVTYKWISINETITKSVASSELKLLEEYETEGRIKIISMTET